jgi:DNA polymerase-3 subunit alpha
MRAILFDTETTGLIENHTIRIDRQPEVIEFYGLLADIDTGEQIEYLDTMIKPSKPSSQWPGNTRAEPRKIQEITGLDDEILSVAPTFAQLAEFIRHFLESRAGMVIAHNLSFDREMIELEYERLCAPVVRWPRLVCTVEQTIAIKGRRMTLTELHTLLFDEPFSGAHRAKTDVDALLRCVVELRRRKVL